MVTGDDVYLEVGETEGRDTRVLSDDRRPQGLIQRVDGAHAFVVGVTLPLAVVLADHDRHADGGDVFALAGTRIDPAAGLDRDLMARNLERRLVVAEHTAHEHLERRLGAFVLPAK